MPGSPCAPLPHVLAARDTAQRPPVTRWRAGVITCNDAHGLGSGGGSGVWVYSLHSLAATAEERRGPEDDTPRGCSPQAAPRAGDSSGGRALDSGLGAQALGRPLRQRRLPRKWFFDGAKHKTTVQDLGDETECVRLGAMTLPTWATSNVTDALTASGLDMTQVPAARPLSSVGVAEAAKLAEIRTRCRTGPMRFPIYLISLETDEGRRRRARTNYKYRLVRGVLGDDVDERFKMTQRSLAFASRAKGAHRSGKIGCFHSHIKAWREVLRHGDSGAVVVEDDAILCRTTGALAGLDVRGIVLLGGCLRCPCSWRKEAHDHLRTGNFLKAFQRLHVGYNALPRGSKITGTLAYYVPPGVARLLLKFYQRYLRSGLAFHEVDQWLMLNGLIKGLMFPNLFIDQDDQIASQCGSNLGDQFSDLYFNRTYRRAARHHGVPLPPRGCSSKVALSWLSGIKRTRVDPDGFAAREERRRLRMNRRTAIAKLGRRLLRLE